MYYAKAPAVVMVMVQVLYVERPAGQGAMDGSTARPRFQPDLDEALGEAAAR